MEAMTTTWERVFDNDESSGPIASLKLTATNVTSDIARLAQALQEAEGNIALGKEEKVIQHEAKINIHI